MFILREFQIINTAHVITIDQEFDGDRTSPNQITFRMVDESTIVFYFKTVKEKDIAFLSIIQSLERGRPFCYLDRDIEQYQIVEKVKKEESKREKEETKVRKQRLKDVGHG